MLNSFLARLNGGPSSTPIHESDARVAVAALLVRAARADDDYSDEERRLIEAILAHRFSLDDDAAGKLRIDGEAADEASVDAYRFTALIRNDLSEADRITVIEALWSIALSDDNKADEESEFIRRVVKMLHIEPRESVFARQRVERAMRGG
ncbi:hypothetical protein GC169_07395 [bacterium]|nr:hypothetical protein [bacterium]